jgi:CRISPR/Cas system endoribonuclease Cas6 (RAMP superfamily)
VPPRERHWTSCERFLIDRTIADLRARGFKASYYEWLTANEVWCSFRLGHRNVIADLGRIVRTVWNGRATARREELTILLTRSR